MFFFYRFLKYSTGVIVFFIVVILGAFYMSNVLNPRFTWAELDLDGNGVVGFGEADYVSSSGTRTVLLGGQECTEYYAYKDGLPLKVVCADNVL